MKPVFFQSKFASPSFYFLNLTDFSEKLKQYHFLIAAVKSVMNINIPNIIFLIHLINLLLSSVKLLSLTSSINLKDCLYFFPENAVVKKFFIRIRACDHLRSTPAYSFPPHFFVISTGCTQSL